MGILSSKSRIMDTILTTEGKAQLSRGDLKAVFVSFSDSQAIYTMDTIVSGSGLEASQRFTFEAGNSIHDQVTMEADDSGLLQAFPITDSKRFVVRQGQILSSSLEGVLGPVTGSQFNSLAESLLENSINNFQNLYILQSPDPLDNREKEFTIGPTQTSFTITPTNPVPTGGMKQAVIDNIESLFYDRKLSHIPNFAFLPPVNSALESGNAESTPLGTYMNLNQEPITTYEQVLEEINQMDLKGYGSTVRFMETSKGNNLACQFFELSNGLMVKLDVIDFGEFPSEVGTKHVFFAGKVFVDAVGSQTFINLFTLVFEA